MRKLWLDFETRSYVDLKESGGHRYATDISTEVLMLAWAFDEVEPKLWLPILGDPMPEELRAGLLDHEVQKMAWNYNFEKKIFLHKLGINVPQGEWFDPSLLCAYMALPIGLDRASNALKIDAMAKFHYVGEENPKKVFSVPSKRKKTELKKNPALSPFYFKDWNTDPEKWKIFCEYCLQDVRAERAVWHAAVAMKCPFPEVEVKAWLIDQRMNNHGVWIDLVYVQGALKYALAEAADIEKEMQVISGLEKTGFTTKLMKDWLAKNFYPFKSTDKAHIDEAIKEAKRLKLTDACVKMLDLKKRLGGSAWSKLQAILDRVSTDGYLRDQFLYHGAHTGRWSGRGVQLQNLFKANGEVSKVLDPVTQAIKNQNLDIPAIVAAYNETEKGKKDPCKGFTLMDAVAGTIRSAFAATPGNKLVMCDLAQIESRVLAALAGCQTMIDAYKSGADLYCDFMTWFLKRLITKKDKAERAHGKVVILGCGFGMGWEKFIEHAAKGGVVVNEKQAKESVYGFREKYPEIPALWKALDEGCKKAVKLGVCVFVNGLIIDGRNPEMLKIKLPNGRYLHYLRPSIGEEETDWGAMRETLYYESWDEKGMSISKLYGGLITENVVQAIARDLLVSGMQEAEKLGFVIVMTIHDELVCEAGINSGLTYKMLEQAMCVVPDWGEGMGFYLGAEGDENPYYKK